MYEMANIRHGISKNTSKHVVAVSGMASETLSAELNPINLQHTPRCQSMTTAIDYTQSKKWKF